MSFPILPKIIVLVASLSIAAIQADARAAEAEAASEAPGPGQLDYGTLYLSEQKTLEAPAWELGLNYGKAFGNEFMELHTLQFAPSRAIGGKSLRRFLRAGIVASAHFSRESDTARALARDLARSGGSLRVQLPLYGAYAFMDLTPVQGHLNLFARSTLPLALRVRGGAGFTAYDWTDWASALTWSLRPAASVTPNLDLEFALNHEWEVSLTNPERVSRWSGQVGGILKF